MKIKIGLLIASIGLGLLFVPEMNHTATSYEKMHLEAITTVQRAHASTINVQISVLYPVLKPVCSCESNGNPDDEPSHYRNGKVIIGKVNPDDVGMCQINTYWHGDTAKKMGLDLWNKDDNARYANHLYDTFGLKPWIYSKPCWKNSVHTGTSTTTFDTMTN